jgi:endonuclease/exonuclease/phosphatase family metal-dependent hydrolase
MLAGVGRRAGRMSTNVAGTLPVMKQSRQRFAGRPATGRSMVRGRRRPIGTIGSARRAVSRDWSAWALLAVSSAAVGAWAAVVQADEATVVRQPRPLRIAAFNAENLAAPGERTTLTRFRFEPARRRHLERIAAVVETLTPDILVMPEVVSRQGVDAVVELLHAKGLTDYSGHHVDGRDKFSGFDVAIIARIEPDTIDGERIHLFVPAATKRAAKRSSAAADDAKAGEEPGADSGEDWMRRAYSYEDSRGTTRREEAVLQRHAVAYFTVGDTKLAVLGMHLKSNPSDVSANAQRAAETAIARELIRRRIVARGYLPIVLGDLNDYDPDVPMADAGRRTRTTVLRDLKDFDDSREGDELVNAAGFIPRQADRYSSHWDFNENGAADGDDVFTLIDHVLVPRELVPAVTRAFICHAIDLDVSDHFPVVVDFDLTRLPRD